VSASAKVFCPLSVIAALHALLLPALLRAARPLLRSFLSFFLFFTFSHFALPECQSW